MIERIVDKIVYQMEKEKIFKQDLKEHYVYALLTMIERWITIATIIIISLFCKRFVPTLIFLSFFFVLRSRTGGFHAPKFWQCYLGTVITYIFIIFISPFLLFNRIIIFVLVAISAILIICIGTINHPNMNMDCLELKESKKAARYLVVLESLIIFSLVLLKLYDIYIIYMSMAIILCAFLLCIAKILKQEV